MGDASVARRSCLAHKPGASDKVRLRGEYRRHREGNRKMRTIAIGTGLTLGAAALALVVVATTPANASPKSYDIETLLRQDMPSWRNAAVRPVPPPQGGPLNRPQMAPSAPAFAPRPAAPPPAFPAPAPAFTAPAVVSAPPPAALPPAPQVRAEPPPAAFSPAPQTGRRVIQAPGSPRSTVSGAWSP